MLTQQVVNYVAHFSDLVLMLGERVEKVQALKALSELF